MFLPECICKDLQCCELAWCDYPEKKINKIIATVIVQELKNRKLEIFENQTLNSSDFEWSCD